MYVYICKYKCKDAYMAIGSLLETTISELRQS